ncbi:hypothetical protein ACOMHN_047120 [Nucella lapillus]
MLLMKTPVEADDDYSEYTDDTSSEYTDYTSSSSRSSSQSSNSSQSSWVTVSSGHEADTESNGDCDSVVPSPTPSFDGERSMHYYSLSRIPHGPEPTQLVEQGLIFEPGSPNVSEETLAEAFAGVEIGDDDVFSSSRPHIPVWPSTDDEKNNSGGQTTDPEYWSNSDSFDSDVAYMNFGTKKPAAETNWSVIEWTTFSPPDQPYTPSSSFLCNLSPLRLVDVTSVTQSSAKTKGMRIM